MLAVAHQRATAGGLTNVRVREGRAEAIPAEDGHLDVVLASLSLMYAIDRAADTTGTAFAWVAPPARRCAGTAGSTRPSRYGPWPLPWARMTAA
jgi:hypothetical protein